jgi:hypothetical protein
MCRLGKIQTGRAERAAGKSQSTPVDDTGSIAYKQTPVKTHYGQAVRSILQQQLRNLSRITAQKIIHSEMPDALTCIKIPTSFVFMVAQELLASDQASIQPLTTSWFGQHPSQEKGVLQCNPNCRSSILITF